MENNLNLDEKIFLTKILKNLYIKKNNLEYFDSLNFDYMNSSINRYTKLIEINNSISCSKINTVFTVLKIKRNSESINYAYIYGNIENNKIVNKFLTTSNSLISKDGMYSHRFISFDKLKRKSALLTQIYNFININYKHKDFEITYDVFNIDDKKIKKKYISSLKDNPLLLHIYIIPWVIELYNMHFNIQEINMNPDYNKIIFSNADRHKFDELYKNHSAELHDLFLYYLFFTFYSKNRLEIGQKIIPFNYVQLKEYNNIVHFQWKEILVNKIATNLLYNLNSPTFSIFIDWFLIKNSNRYLYDNKSIYDKILYSDKIKNILYLLNKANKEFINIYSNQKNDFINSLIKRLKKIIKLSENKILMSNISLCYLSEYSGRTIYDYYNKIKDNDKIHKNIGDLFTNFDLFQKYMFEIIYGLYCLNLRGVIHGDLHLNNVTLNKKNLNVKENSYVLYNISKSKNESFIKYINETENIKNESDEKINIIEDIENNKNMNKNINDNKDIKYLFHHTGTYPCIIDFSRSFILLKLVDENIIEKSKNTIRAKFIKNEQNRIMSELKKIFPNFVKNSAHKLKFLFKNKNFNILFIFFSAFDIFKFSSNLLIFINKFSMSNNIKVNEKITELLTNIAKKSYFFLEKIIDEESYTNKEKIEFPNFILLTEFFTSFIINNDKLDKKLKSITIVDVFNIESINQNYSITEIINEINENIKIETEKIKNKENIKQKNNITDIKSLDILLNKISNFINYSKQNEDIEIEQLINTEYYNIKSHLSQITTDNFSTSTSSNEFSINNF